jgi:phosphomethylpyrimidine synthase
MRPPPGPVSAREFHDETLPLEGASTAHFYSMKIAEGIRQYAASQALRRRRSV